MERVDCDLLSLTAWDSLFSLVLGSHRGCRDNQRFSACGKNAARTQSVQDRRSMTIACTAPSPLTMSRNLADRYHGAPDWRGQALPVRHQGCSFRPDQGRHHHLDREDLPPTPPTSPARRWTSTRTCSTRTWISLQTGWRRGVSGALRSSCVVSRLRRDFRESSKRPDLHRHWCPRQDSNLRHPL